MVRDLRASMNRFSTPFRSVYFGGGTPSLAPASVFAAILDHAPIDAEAEVTIEIEPDTISRQRLRELVELGVNRASLGWQSTHDRLLKKLGRGHDAAAASRMFGDARAVGFRSVSIDLIFAVPGQRMADLDLDLDAVVAMAPEHVSLYALTFEPGTEFDARRRSGRLIPTDEDLELAMMNRISERLIDAGYRHYEVSNFAQPGFEAVHNGGYWAGLPYLGVGPGAHSYLPHARGASRWMTAKDPSRYERDASVEWQEELTPRMVLTERLLTAMRLDDGIDVALLGTLPADVLEAASEAESRAWLERRGTRWRATSLGRRHADSLGAMFASEPSL